MQLFGRWMRRKVKKHVEDRKPENKIAGWGQYCWVRLISVHSLGRQSVRVPTIGSWSGWQHGQSWAAFASVPGTEGKPIEKQCDGHNGRDRLAASTGFLLLWPEINHKYPHWPPPTARQASTPTHTLTVRQTEKREKKEERRRAWLVRGAVKHKPSR